MKKAEPQVPFVPYRSDDRAPHERVLELNRNDQMVDVLSFEGWLEPGTYNVKSMKSASEILKAMVDKRIALAAIVGMHQHSGFFVGDEYVFVLVYYIDIRGSG